MNLNNSIIKIRVDLQNSKLKKSGKNAFAGFTYFELKDFLPKLNDLMLQEGINDNISINDDVMTLTLVKDDERQEYSIPFIIYDTPLSKNGNKSMQDIQYLGALNTYYKRYLYLNAFGITDGEVVDSMDNTHPQEKPVTEQPKTSEDHLEIDTIECWSCGEDAKQIFREDGTPWSWFDRDNDVMKHKYSCSCGKNSWVEVNE